MKRFIMLLAIFAIVATACSNVSKDEFSRAQDETSKALSKINNKLDQLATSPAPADPTGPTGTTGATGSTGATGVSGPSGSTGSVSSGNGQFTPSGSVGTPVSTNNVGSWQVQEMKNLSKNPIVVDWINRLKDPAPRLWPTYPNVDNPKVGFSKHNGLEFGQDIAPFCEQDSRCDFIVPAREYRLITGDYKFLDLSCQGGKERKGCLLMIINVSDESYTWRDQVADNGYTVMGRYWNGDVLEQGVWGLVSHASANMLNLPTSAHPGESLNFGSNGTNAGANCGNPAGCNTVDATVVVAAGSGILAVLHTVVHA